MKKSSVVPLVMLGLFLLPFLIYLFLFFGTEQKFERVPFQYTIMENGDTAYHSFPNFTLNNLYGDSIRRSDLEGKICLLGFFSVNDDSLKKTTVLFGNLKRVYDNIDWEKNPSFQFVFVNMGDNPEEVNAFVNSLEVDTQKWMFLSGEQDEIYKLAMGGFVFPDFIRKAPGDAPFTAQTVVMTDKSGKARNYYIATDLQQERTILEDFIALLRVDYGL
ncbi:MAG: SCO family protein [Bacteroidetes bacterium]|nr:SCO family protein [Bacteroidota bacterium]MCB0842379.1 SCO family protein [Bacteroidota bacterium]